MMHFGPIIRKSIFLLSGRPFLMDPVRNFSYAWAWSYLRNLNKGDRILDVGTRQSTFPAFLAWRHFNIISIERDDRFTPVQEGIRREWNVAFEHCACDLLSFNPPFLFSSVVAILALQHAGDRDIASYEKCCDLLAANGRLLIVNEYSSGDTRWQHGRDDGDMRIYGNADIETRIEKPLASKNMKIVDKRFASFGDSGKKPRWTAAPESRNLCFYCFQKSKQPRP
jgi:hypothetical protein